MRHPERLFAEKASSAISCDAEQLSYVQAPEKVWSATGCDRVAMCGALQTSEFEIETECKETDESHHRTIKKIVTDRLALETNCPKERVTIEKEMDWRRGSEEAFRMRACGRPFVCTTADGRTDCKAALDAEPAKSQ
jgi:hypothetical protein